MRCSNDADVTKGGDDGTVPIPEPLRPYLDAALKLSPSKWVFPAPDGSQRAPDKRLYAPRKRHSSISEIAYDLEKLRSINSATSARLS